MPVEEEMALAVFLLLFEIKFSVYLIITLTYLFVLSQRSRGRTSHCVELFALRTELFPYKMRMETELSEEY